VTPESVIEVELARQAITLAGGLGGQFCSITPSPDLSGYAIKGPHPVGCVEQVRRDQLDIRLTANIHRRTDGASHDRG
jgi:hypothetical protein